MVLRTRYLKSQSDQRQKAIAFDQNPPLKDFDQMRSLFGVDPIVISDDQNPPLKDFDQEAQCAIWTL